MGSKLSTRRRRRQWRRQRRNREWESDYVDDEEEEDYDSQEPCRRFTNREEWSFDSDESSSCTSKQEKCYDPLDPTLTFVDGDDDLDFLCNDYKSLRAKMSCGHAVTPMSLTEWCCWLLDQGECRFVCGQPGCDVEWPFEEVCKMALLTPEEMEYFEKKQFSNAATDYLDVKACPGCKSQVMRADVNDLSVKCTMCTADRKRTYTFCWQCLREWKGSAPRSDRCENEDCQNPVEILKSCPNITFKDVEGVEFCFVCLKLTEECQRLSDDDDEEDVFSFYEPCSTGVAPRQTSIPVWQKT
ncbi:uncharacterized protein [Pempheris klunzingeri]|uniref:uncharacterized protein n=1 Tax=Pempheris klunzingeri TaxID=3127111 RepID=UPI003981942F